MILHIMCTCNGAYVMSCVVMVCSVRQITSAIGATTLKEIKKAAMQYGVIGIDEGQFVSLLK